MFDALAVHRLHFAFTVTYHYLFPQLTMGLALLIVILKTMALRTGDEHYNRAARFWAKIFGINFAMGVVTGIPMEFQFGTNWAQFSRAAGGVIGQTLAMEGVFSFFLESSFLGLFLFGEKRLGSQGSLVRRLHGVPGLLAFGLPDCCHGRLDATSSRLRDGAERRNHADQFLGTAPESLGAVAVRAQHERRGHHRGLRHGRAGSILFAGRKACRPTGQTFVRVGVIAGAHRHGLPTLPQRRRPRPHGGPPPTRNPGRHGRACSTRSRERPSPLIGQPDMEKQAS